MQLLKNKIALLFSVSLYIVTNVKRFLWLSVKIFFLFLQIDFPKEEEKRLNLNFVDNY